MTGRSPSGAPSRRTRTVVALILVAAAVPLVAQLVPDHAWLAWSAGAALAVTALVTATRGRRAGR
jgi:VIT1/CCC1 family predicted Fe2+/Mn2+ transporter